MTDDWFGDLLREFYAKYGAAGEGPPPNMNLCARKNGSVPILRTHRERLRPGDGCFYLDAFNRSLSVPLLCSGAGARSQAKGPHQARGRLTQRQAV